MQPARVAFITGCSSGFGLLAAIDMARNGFHVFASMRDTTKAKKFAGILKKEKLSVDIIEMDVLDQKSIKKAVHAAHETFGRIDVLVNNAGVGLGGFFEDTSLEDFEMVWKTNVFGLIAVTKEVVPIMRQGGGGHIINLSSIAGIMGRPMMSAYSASKYAVEGLSQSLYYELSPFNIKVALVEPGTFKTEIFTKNKHMAEGAKDQKSIYHKASIFLENLAEKRVAKTGGDPQKVANLITRIARTKNPKLRYPIGKDLKTEIFLRKALSSKFVDSIFKKLIKNIYKKNSL